MSLAVRIIPTLLMRGDKLVKGQRFQSWRTVGHIEQAMRIYQRRSVDEVILLDIEATPEGRGPDFARIKALTHGFYTPVTVGGGVRSKKDLRELLACGADKVAIGTAVCEVPDLITHCADSVGSQAVVVALDVGYENSTMIGCGRHGWSSDPVGYARFCQEAGAGEILLTSVDREGTMQGYDLSLIEAVARAVTIPVIAHGGCGSYLHMLQAIAAGASAVAAGALFQFTDATPRGAAEWLAMQGVETRVPA